MTGWIDNHHHGKSPHNWYSGECNHISSDIVDHHRPTTGKYQEVCAKNLCYQLHNKNGCHHPIRIHFKLIKQNYYIIIIIIIKENLLHKRDGKETGAGRAQPVGTVFRCRSWTSIFFVIQITISDVQSQIPIIISSRIIIISHG